MKSNKNVRKLAATKEAKYKRYRNRFNKICCKINYAINNNNVFAEHKGTLKLMMEIKNKLERVVCLGESRLSQVNNSPLPNVFPAGVANFG